MFLKMADTTTWLGFLQIICTIHLCTGSSGSEPSLSKRNVTSTFNEGCNMTFCLKPNGSSYINLFHVTAKGENDTIHFLWSSYGALTGIVVRTTNNASLSIDWKMMEKKEIVKEQNAISFLPKDSVLYSSAVIFSRLIDFNDTNDTASLSKATAMKVKLFENLSWDNFNLTIDHKRHQGRFVSPSLSSQSLGNLSLMVQSFEDEGRGSLLPRLRHTSNSSYFEFALKNISTAYKQSRFAVEVILVGGDKQQNGTSFSISRSIADQYTPSVFYVDNINFANSNSCQGGYMSWKPVTYTEEARHLANGRMVHQYGLNTTSVGYVPTYSIAHAFYGNLSQLNLSSMNVSFGNDGDGYYAASNYLVWGGLIGYGEAPLDGLSTLILIIISAGLGLPALLILGGGSVICLKKLAKKRNYDKIMVDPGVN